MIERSKSKLHFKLEWKGGQLGFTEVTGLDIQVEAVGNTSGNSTDHPRIITFKKGWMEHDSQINDSWNHYFKKDKIKHNLIISLFNENNSLVKVWNLSNARLLNAERSLKNDSGSEVAIEVLEFEWEVDTLPSIKK